MTTNSSFLISPSAQSSNETSSPSGAMWSPTDAEKGPSVNQPLDESRITLYLYVAGSVITVCILLTISAAIFLWRSRRKQIQRMYSIDDEVQWVRRSSVYTEVSEKYVKTTDLNETSCQQQSNDDLHDMVKTEKEAGDLWESLLSAGGETAPDIIASHDGEGIYETLDGKYRARAKSVDLMVQAQGSSAIFNTSAMSENEAMYDHLNRDRQNKIHFEQCGHLAANHPLIADINGPITHCKHCKAIETILKNNKKHDLCFANQPAIDKSACSDDLLHKCSVRKKIVCHLTMLAVLEEGQPVQMPAGNATNAYYVLESQQDGSSSSSISKCELIPGRKLAIRDKAACRNEEKQYGQRCEQGRHEYFILEPLDEQDSVAELISNFSASSTRDQQNVGSYHGCRYSLHGLNSASCLLEERSNQRITPTFQKDVRIKSCPVSPSEPSPSALVPKPHGYMRSHSSPAQTHKSMKIKDRKLNPEFLQTRIQHEMKLLGLAPTDETRTANYIQTDEAADDICRNDKNETKLENEYFTLLPESSDGVQEESLHDVVCESHEKVHTQFYVRNNDVTKTSPKNRYQRHKSHEPSPPLPPRTYKGSKHIRSRSDTRVLNDNGDEGPVIVSLHKSQACQHKANQKTTTTAANGNGSQSEIHCEPFRPRFKSDPTHFQ